MNGTMSTAPPLSPKLNLQLSVMMFLQYAIWGSWLPIFFTFLTTYRNFSGEDAGSLFAGGAVGALVAPFLAGQIADRYFNTEKYLGISHILGGVLVWQLARIQSYWGLMGFGLLYALIYVPTLNLTNSLAFHHLPDRDRDFGKVRVWGTIGWIAVGIGVGHWLRIMHTPSGVPASEVLRAQAQGMGDAFRLSAILGWILGIWCFMLPKTPPKKGEQKFAPLEALGQIKARPLLVLFLLTFPISCVHQFYFVRTSGFLATLQSGATDGIDNFFKAVFGVGGGGLMTIGQIAEIAVLAVMPIVAKRASRKTLLTVGVMAYILRFAVFAYLPFTAAVVPALALHGLCFGCFFFVAFMIVDEETTADVRASAQGLYNLVGMGLGVIAGNYFAGKVDRWATVVDPATGAKSTNFQILFSIPMWICVACLVALVLFYPSKKTGAVKTAGTEAVASA
jgi:nucleoside transporter